MIYGLWVCLTRAVDGVQQTEARIIYKSEREEWKGYHALAERPISK